MIKLTPTVGTLTAGSTIPLTLVFNTNPNFSLSNNVVSTRKLGYAEFKGTVDVTATVAGPIAVSLMVDGTAVSTFSTVAAAIGDLITIPVYDLFRVLPATFLDGFAKVSLQLENAATISGGIITGEYVR